VDARVVAGLGWEVPVDSAEGADIEEFGVEDAEEVEGTAGNGADAHRVAASGGGDG